MPTIVTTMTTPTPTQTGAASNSNSGNCSITTNNSNPNPTNGGSSCGNKRTKKTGGGQGNGKNGAKKRPGFKGSQASGAMMNITLSTDKTIQLSNQYKKFLEAAMAHANNAGMSYVADCTEDLEEKPDTFFKAANVDLSNCVSVVKVQMKNEDGTDMEDVDGNPVVTEIQTITDTSAYKTAKEFRKHRTRKKEDKRQKFIQDKLLLHGIIMG